MDILRFLLVTSFVILLASPATLKSRQTAQPTPRQTCDSPIVSSREVDRKLKILSKPAPKFSDSEMDKYRNQEVLLQAALCGSGEILNIKVLRSVSDTVDAKAIEAAQKIRFTPAEKDGAKVSTAVNLVYRITVTRIR